MRRSFIVAGLAWGDEGKGATVDFLTWQRDAKLIVRYNGGSQAGHNVITPDGRHHTFAQFGSGTFHPGVKTHLSRFMLVDPIDMMREEEHLRMVGVQDAFERTTVEDGCLIITPYHKHANRLMTNGNNTTCGRGIGMCRKFHLDYGDKALFAGDLRDRDKTFEKLRFMRHTIAATFPGNPDFNGSKVLVENELDYCWQRYEMWRERVAIVPTGHLRSLLDETRCTIFEGAQGVLLDETHGEPGFNTWTDTTFNNAEKLLEESSFDGQKIKMGVLRTYATRHGAGPFPTEDPLLKYPEPHNNGDGYQGKFRIGHFDHAAYCRALDIIGGVDGLAWNHFDVVEFPAFIPDIEITIRGMGPTFNDRIWW